MLPLASSDNERNFPGIGCWIGTKLTSQMFIWDASRMIMFPFIMMKKQDGNSNLVPFEVSGCTIQLKKLSVLALYRPILFSYGSASSTMLNLVMHANGLLILPLKVFFSKRFEKLIPVFKACKKLHRLLFN